MTAHKQGDPTTLNRLYGRSSGHKLRKGQAELVETLLPADRGAGGGRDHARSGCSAMTARFISRSASARGEHLAYRADLLPDHGFIGCEPFLNGVADALGHVRDQRLANVRLHMGDALDVLRRLPDQCADAWSICSTPTPGPRRATPSGG